MMKHNFLSPILLALLVGSSISACGGSSSPGVTSKVAATPAADTSSTSVGIITGFGSVHVNGIHYRTDNATQITMDGLPSSEGALKVGQVVTVHGTIDADGLNGNADSISMQEEVRGPIEAIGAGQLTVLGQTVLVNADTLFDRAIVPADLTGLAIGDLVEVSGFRNAENAIAATFIELETSGHSFEVQGAIENVDTSLFTFSIGGLVIDYSSAQLSGIPGAVLSNGLIVEVEGISLGATQELIATKVEFEDLHDGENHDGNASEHGHEGTELEGLVTRFVSTADFDVAGHAVSTNSNTRYKRGNSTNLAMNARVEVEGDIDAAGVLIATTVEFRGVPKLEVEGSIDAVSAGSVTILGITVSVDANTVYRDDSTANLRTFSLKDIVVGDYLSVSGSAVTGLDTQVQASKIRRHNPTASVEIEGPVMSIVNSEITVLGVVISSDATTVFKGRNGHTVTSTDFFAQLSVGEQVSIRGSATGTNSVVASRIEYEDENDD